MINGKLGLLLAIGMIIVLPVERWQFSGLGPVDGFIILLILTAWPVIWRRRSWVYFPLALAVWLIFIGSLIGALSRLDVGAALKALLQEVYLFTLLLTMANAVVDKKAFLTLNKIWAIVATMEGVLLILGRIGVTIPILAGGGKAALLGDERLSEIGRSVGTFINANAAGGYMMISIFLLLAIPFRSTPRRGAPRYRPVRLAMIVLLIGGLLSSGSNGALLGLLLGLALAALYWLHQRGRIILFMLAMGSLVVTLLVFSSPLIVSLLSSSSSSGLLVAFSRVDNKLSKRLELWSASIELATKHPTGIGPNVTASVTGIGAHNDYVAFISERGVLGLIGLFVLLGEILFWLVLAARASRSGSSHLATGALLGGLIGLSVMAASHEVTHGRAVWLLFAMIFLHYKFVRSEFGVQGSEFRVRSSEFRVQGSGFGVRSSGFPVPS